MGRGGMEFNSINSKESSDTAPIPSMSSSGADTERGRVERRKPSSESMPSASTDCTENEIEDSNDQMCTLHIKAVSIKEKISTYQLQKGLSKTEGERNR